MSLHYRVQKLDGTDPAHWRNYQCGYCNQWVSGLAIAQYEATIWLLCPSCLRGSVRVDNQISPGSKFGPSIDGLPTLVESAYDEARRCMSVSAFTASELICRKILMHIAVDKGADEGKQFVYYLQHLENQGYITPPMKGWTDKIREHGNEATHEIKEITQQRAEGTVMFTAELLRLVYEMEHLKNKYSPPNIP